MDKDIPFKQILRDIQLQQLSTFVTWQDFKKKEKPSNLNIESRGLYWLWTNLDYEELMKAEKKAGKTKEVPISDMVSQRKQLNYTCNIMNEKGFYVIYNGIGGYKHNANGGLQKRIRQEMNCDSKGTGTLNLKRINQGGKNDKNLGISFFDFKEEKSIEILKQLPIKINHYTDYAPTLELLWRVEYGIPILTRH